MKTEQLNNILQMRVQNLSYDKIAELTGYSSRTVYRILKKNRIELSTRKSAEMENALRNFEAFENQRMVGAIKHYSRLVCEFDSRPLAEISSERLLRMISLARKQLDQMAQSIDKEIESSDRLFDKDIDFDLETDPFESPENVTDAPSQPNPTHPQENQQENGLADLDPMTETQSEEEQPSSLISLLFIDPDQDRALKQITPTQDHAPIPFPKADSVLTTSVKSNPHAMATPSIPVTTKVPKVSDDLELTADERVLLKQIPNKRIPFKRPAIDTPILELVNKAHQSVPKSPLQASQSLVLKPMIKTALLKEQVA